MKIEDIKALINAENVTNDAITAQKVESAYVCDMLSMVIKNGAEYMALITIQTNLNIVAVCVLCDASLIIIPEGLHAEQSTVSKANEENIVILETKLSAFEVSGILYNSGLPSVSIK